MTMKRRKGSCNFTWIHLQSEEILEKAISFLKTVVLLGVGGTQEFRCENSGR
jgi:hypothetical protein